MPRRTPRAGPTLAPAPSPYDYYPARWFDPYLARRRENGWGLYGLLGIAKGDKEAMHTGRSSNFASSMRRSASW